jgi:HlyD family secretion protein
MKRRTLIFLMMLAAVIAAAIIYSVASKDDSIKPLETEVKQGKFEILVTVTGELQAQTSTDITAPLLLRSRELRLHRIKIQDLIAEGTVVDSGDYVATLDRSEADNTYKDISDELEVRESDYTKTKLDTTIQLRELRDEMINLEFNMEEAEITLEQSLYEPPTTIRQAKINLDKATRAYEQAVKNYQLKVQQAKADMTEVTVDLAKQRRRKAQMEDVLQQFVIHAPAPGMVIYKREWSGQKRTVGSEISPWDLTVATLPDMSTMVSKTYVNEIDISKIKVGQVVRAGVDAFPEKQYTGMVTEVANIGEQLPNTDAKVFEVVIKLNESDPILRPSMTTSNSIITETYDSVLYIPLEAVHSNDSMTYVYMKNNTKQVVVLDESNENEIIVEAGLSAGDKILLSVPEGAEAMKFTGLELVEVIRQKESEKKRMEEELQKKREEDQIQRNLRRRMQSPADAPRAGAQPAATVNR